MGGFRAEPPQPDGKQRAQLVHVATDGESYGHHHRYGEMALSWALKQIERRGEAKLTNYGEFLSKFPPQYEAEIYENTSWSCFHGVERWRSDCGCNGGKAGWNQKWRAPLRSALDWLRDTVADVERKAAKEIFTDLWKARDAYIEVVLARGEVAAGRANAQVASADSFLNAHATHLLDSSERITALKLLEMQRHAMLMYTSCGWFFDDISGIETVQIIAYAGRVIQLATEVFGADAAELEAGFVERLRAAKSNVADAERRRRDLSSPGEEAGGRAGRGCRPLRDQLSLHQLSGGDAAVRLLRAAARRRVVDYRAGAAGHRPGDGVFTYHRGAGAGLVCRAAFRRSEHQRRGEALAG